MTRKPLRKIAHLSKPVLRFDCAVIRWDAGYRDAHLDEEVAVQWMMTKQLQPEKALPPLN